MGNGKGGGESEKKLSPYTQRSLSLMFDKEKASSSTPSLIFFEIWDMVLSNSTAPSPPRFLTKCHETYGVV